MRDEEEDFERQATAAVLATGAMINRASLLFLLLSLVGVVLFAFIVANKFESQATAKNLISTVAEAAFTVNAPAQAFYAALRAGVQLLPDGAAVHLPWIVFLTLINVVYGAFIAFRQRDFKYVIGFSSVSHIFCNMCQSCGCAAIPSASTSARRRPMR